MLAALEEHEERRIKKSNIKVDEKKEKVRDRQNNILKYLKEQGIISKTV